MKATWIAMALAIVALPIVSHPALAQSVDPVLDAIAGQIQGSFKDLTGLDESDKKIKQSGDAQVYSSQTADKLEREVKDEAPGLQMEANAADALRAQLLAMGCPENGGMAPTALAQRCNPLIEQHRIMRQKVLDHLALLQQKAATVRALRTGVSQTTLANTAQQKANAASRDTELDRISQLQVQAIHTVITHKAAAARACKASGSPGAQACCLSVVYDGADPKRCGVRLICTRFESAGLFGNRVICRPSR